VIVGTVEVDVVPHWKCPHCGDVSEKTDQQKVLCHAHEDGAIAVLTGASGTVGCGCCQGGVSLARLAKGEFDHVVVEPVEQPNLFIAIGVGAMLGAMALGGLTSLLVGADAVRIGAGIGAVLGVIASVRFWLQHRAEQGTPP
jgi:hypothetical protein